MQGITFTSLCQCCSMDACSCKRRRAATGACWAPAPQKSKCSCHVPRAGAVSFASPIALGARAPLCTSVVGGRGSVTMRLLVWLGLLACAAGVQAGRRLQLDAQASCAASPQGWPDPAAALARPRRQLPPTRLLLLRLPAVHGPLLAGRGGSRSGLHPQNNQRHVQGSRGGVVTCWVSPLPPPTPAPRRRLLCSAGPAPRRHPALHNPLPAQQRGHCRASRGAGHAGKASRGQAGCRPRQAAPRSPAAPRAPHSAQAAPEAAQLVLHSPPPLCPVPCTVCTAVVHCRYHPRRRRRSGSRHAAPGEPAGGRLRPPP